MFDIYLTGYTNTEWRTEFKNRIARDITVFDPIDPKYDSFNASQKANQVAKELKNIEDSEVVLFYLCREWDSAYSMLKLGDAVGRGKQVIVLIDADTKSAEKITWYCEYRGVLVVNNMDDLIENVEEYLAQADLVKAMSFVQLPLPQGEGIVPKH